MDNFQFYSPTEFIFGRDSECETGKYVKKYGGHRVLLHYGGGSAVRSGLLERVKASLQKEGISFTELGGVRSSPHSDLVYAGIRLVRQQGVDFILAVGGGSVMDSAKAIALGALYDADVWDFYCGKAEVLEALPVGCVVTMAGSGSEGATDSMLTLDTQDGKHYKRCAAGDALRPLFSIMNPLLTVTLPPYQTASGIADILSHCMERYFTHTEGVELTDRILEAIMVSVIHEGRRVMAEPENYDARANLMWAATLAQNNSTGLGRSADWGTHHMENQLGAMYGCSHGAGLAVLFPSWMEYALRTQGAERFVLYANRVWGCQIDEDHPETTAREGIQAFQRFMTELGLPSRIRDLGGKAEDIAQMTEAMFFCAPSHGSFVKLTPEIVAEIYSMAL